MNRESVQLIPLRDAVLCVACEMVSNSESVCQHCLSTELMHLSDKLGMVGEPRARLMPPITLPPDHTHRLTSRIAEVLHKREKLQERRKEAGIGEADGELCLQQRMCASGREDEDAGNEPRLLPGTHADAADLRRGQ